MKSTLSILLSAITLATLTACGGGGGDSPPQQGAAKVAITSTNQGQVVRASVNAGLSVSLPQGSAGGASVAGVASRAQSLGAVAQRAVHAAQASRKGIASASAHPSAALSDTEPCAVSGTMTITLDDRDNNQAVSKNDVVSASFAQCKDSATSSINGAITITLTDTPTDTQFSASANFQNLVAIDGGVTASLSGIVSVGETDTANSTETFLTVGQSGLTVSVASSDYTDSVIFDSGMLIHTLAVSDPNGFVSTILDGSFTVQSLGGKVTVATPLGLTQNNADAFPSSGQLEITGASGSKVRATVLDKTQVRLELDANGDGTYEATSTVAWSTLIG